MLENPNFEIIYEEDKVEEGDLEACKNFLSTNSELKLMQMNVCSIRSKYNRILVMLKTISDLDCMIFTEAHLKNFSHVELLSIENYSLHNTTHHVRKTDGIVVFMRQGISHNIKEFIISDGNCLQIDFETGNKKFICLAIYRSPNGKQDKFLNELQIILDKMNQTCLPNTCKLLVGDINIDLLKNKCKIVNQYKNIMAEAGFISLINKITRSHKDANSCIDHIFIGPQKDVNCNTFILQSTISDHFTTLLNIKKDPEHNQTKKKPNSEEYMENKKINFDNLLKDIENEKWENILGNDNATASISLFLENYVLILTKSILIK
uniref:Endonuclease/exonuclease/phosphatase domain-containing protein n=1 Tax=Cacopsylla melanoneura TaxID=428564 RepID=A0A8D9E8T8_9HEMI